MPKIARVLSSRAVASLKHTGPGVKSRHPVGGAPGLLVVVSASGAKSWLLRATYKRRRKEFGLGSTLDVSLAEARAKAIEYRRLLSQGIDPSTIGDEGQDKFISFKNAVAKFCDTELEGVKEKERKAWLSTLSRYATPVIGNYDVDDITTVQIANVLKPIWASKRELAKKIRVRLDKIFVWLKAKGYRSEASPAKWVDLKPILDPLGRNKATTHHPAINFKSAPGWFEIVQSKSSISARALEFLCLTAVRSGDVRFMPWSEVDLETMVWTIPPLREGTKLKEREHQVPITQRMLNVLRQMEELRESEYVFPSAKGGPLSDNTLSKMMRHIHGHEIKDGRPGFLDQQSGRPAVPHGLRSTFRDWVAECTDYPGELAEIAIQHKHGTNTELAYRRLAQVEKRRPLMKQWGEYLSKGS